MDSHVVAIPSQEEITIDYEGDYLVVRQGTNTILLHNSNAEAFAECVKEYRPNR